MNILYVGEIHTGSTCSMRMTAFQDLGHQVVPINTHASGVHRGIRSLAPRILSKLGYPLDFTHANREILKQAAAGRFDLIWLDKALTIHPRTLQSVRKLQPQATIAGYSPDDMAARHCQSRYFIGGLGLYDIYFTTKTYGVAELKALGIPRVRFSGNAYDSHTHRPISVTDEERRRFGGAVGFIGDYERERAEFMHFLAQNAVSVRVWGPNWNRCTLVHPNLVLENRPLWADDYARAICAFDINLGFLRRINRDRQTQRSVEIPACGAFMLAERTEEHLGLFNEGTEAQYFNSPGELLEKVRYYLEHPGERGRIAMAGRQRCLDGAYSYRERLRQCLAEIEVEVSR